MVCYYRAEECEYAGILTLNKLSNVLDKNNISLYRDDGLDVFDKLSEPQIEGRRKLSKFSKTFNSGNIKYYIYRLSRYNFKFEKLSFTNRSENQTTTQYIYKVI